MPTIELVDASASTVALPEQMRCVRMRIRRTGAAYEATSETNVGLLDEVRTLLSASTHVETRLQQATGYNVIQYRVVRSYHLRAIAFFEEVIARRL